LDQSVVHSESVGWSISLSTGEFAGQLVVFLLELC